MTIFDTLHMIPGTSIDEPVTTMVSGTTMLEYLPLAMSYVPMQEWGAIYEGLKALDSGTLFPDLDLPFCGRRLSK